MTISHFMYNGSLLTVISASDMAPSISPSKLVFICGKAITLIILPQLECGELG